MSNDKYEPDTVWLNFEIFDDGCFEVREGSDTKLDEDSVKYLRADLAERGVCRAAFYGEGTKGENVYECGNTKRKFRNDLKEFCPRCGYEIVEDKGDD